MWDTAKDYRILIAMHARELFLRTVQTGSFRGNWNKKGAIEETKRMEPDLKSLLYCYLEGDTLANCEDVDKLEEKANRIIDFLGGEDWAHKFMNNYIPQRMKGKRLKKTLLRSDSSLTPF